MTSEHASEFDTPCLMTTIFFRRDIVTNSHSINNLLHIVLILQAAAVAISSTLIRIINVMTFGNENAENK